jgi:hypothetical protein
VSYHGIVRKRGRGQIGCHGIVVDPFLFFSVSLLSFSSFSLPSTLYV